MMHELTRIIPPWCIKVRSLLPYRGLSAVNGKEDIILCPYPTKCCLKKLEKETCELQILKKGEGEDIKCNYLAVDEDDTVCLLTHYGQESRYDLFICDSNGKVIHHNPIEFSKGKEYRCLGITKDKKLVFCCEFEQNVYTLDKTVLYIFDRNGQKNTFPVRISDKRVVKDMFSSNSNEIVLVTVRKHDTKSKSIVLYLYSDDGRLEREVKLKLPVDSGSPSSCTVRYDYRANNFICLALKMIGGMRMCRYLQFCSETGELRKSCDLNFKHLGFNKPNLTCHPKGNVAL
ncbi:Hypothetical predicted protein, partial [Paramuricea clavata]